MNEAQPKIYLLPNLMTAGNLFCGFAAVMKILEGALYQATDPIDAASKFYVAIWFILGACVFDLLDGRLARLGGKESPFGREFDSLADVVSFGVAPALMVYKIILLELPPEPAGIIASIYLVCGALRLARFNCMAAEDTVAANKEFKGFPIPAAAGLIASLTLLLLWAQAEERNLRYWRFALAGLMLFLSWMMFSGFRYPSFKSINWRTRRSLPVFIVIVAVGYLTWLFKDWMPAVLFVAYLLYGFLRPWISQAWRKRIEEEEDEEEGADDANPDEPSPPQAP